MTRANHRKKKEPATLSLPARVLQLLRLQRVPSPGEKVLVGVSGGADSLTLLHILALPELGLRLHALYLDHGLRPQQTPLEEALVAEVCARLNCQFSCKKIAVLERMQHTGESLEEAARKLRHHLLEQERQLQQADWIALGHTADDQVEEYFLRLFRGTTLTGISGMHFRRDRIIRPLLGESKASLCSYLREIGQSWAEDASNQDQSYLRNRIRHRLLPDIEENYQPALRQVILRHMAILQEEDELLQFQAQEVLFRITRASSPPAAATLSCREMLTQPRALVRRALDQQLGRLNIPASTGLLVRLLTLATEGKNGDQLHLPGNWRVERLAADLLFIRLAGPPGRAALPEAENIDLEIPGPGSYAVPGIASQLNLSCHLTGETEELPADSLVLDRDKVAFPLRLRSLRPGDRFHPFGRPGSKKVVRYLSDKKIPARQRAAWPVLLQGDTIIALPGLEIADLVKTDDNTTCLLVISFATTSSPQ